MKDPNWRKCIINGDSRDYIKRIPDNSIDFIFTDPPYNIGKHSTGNIPLPGRSAMNNDVADWDWIDFDPNEWADEFVRILKPTGNLFIFTSYNQIGKWYDCLDNKFDASNFMVWHKTNPAPKIFKAGFLNSCELIFTCWNKKHTWNFISQKEMHNFLESPICMKPERLSNPKHPAQKPTSILEKIITIASNENDIIFDPFMGVGSIGVAALNLNRRYIGIDINYNYFLAAKDRIETMAKKNKTQNIISEPAVDYGKQSLFDINKIFGITIPITKKNISELKPIIKWAGGKEKELKYIIPNLPEKFNRYFEPFVGGGSVFMSIKSNEYYINDLSEELISLYNNIATSNKQFYRYAEAINIAWHKAGMFFNNHHELVDLYQKYRASTISNEELKTYISHFCELNYLEILNILDENLLRFENILIPETSKNIYRKMTRMRDLELKKFDLPERDLYDNIETSIKSALYMNFRNLYNSYNIKQQHKELHSALFLFIRNYSYSGMFRYNDKGEFNVPYGGIAYNSKTLDKKLDYYKSEEVHTHLNETNIYNLDFETFLKKCAPNENDFIFLDPPYDSEFSTYAQNEFTREDQTRLANYLIYECKAKWMMIIKNTEFIYSLYNKDGIKIKSFEKEYLVSFMNRNDKKVTHLIITNY